MASAPVTRFAGIELLRRTFAIWRWTTPSIVSRFMPCLERGPEGGVERRAGLALRARPAEHVAAAALLHELGLAVREVGLVAPAGGEGERRPRVATSAARSGLTVFRSGLTGREHYPLAGPETVAPASLPWAAAITPSATLSQP